MAKYSYLPPQSIHCPRCGAQVGVYDGQGNAHIEHGGRSITFRTGGTTCGKCKEKVEIRGALGDRS